MADTLPKLNLMMDLAELQKRIESELNQLDDMNRGNNNFSFTQQSSNDIKRYIKNESAKSFENKYSKQPQPSNHGQYSQAFDSDQMNQPNNFHKPQTQQPHQNTWMYDDYSTQNTFQPNSNHGSVTGNHYPNTGYQNQLFLTNNNSMNNYNNNFAQMQSSKHGENSLQQVHQLEISGISGTSNNSDQRFVNQKEKNGKFQSYIQKALGQQKASHNNRENKDENNLQNKSCNFSNNTSSSLIQSQLMGPFNLMNNAQNEEILKQKIILSDVLDWTSVQNNELGNQNFHRDFINNPNSQNNNDQNNYFQTGLSGNENYLVPQLFDQRVLEKNENKENINFQQRCDRDVSPSQLQNQAMQKNSSNQFFQNNHKHSSNNSMALASAYNSSTQTQSQNSIAFPHQTAQNTFNHNGSTVLNQSISVNQSSQSNTNRRSQRIQTQNYYDYQRENSSTFRTTENRGTDDNFEFFDEENQDRTGSVLFKSKNSNWNRNSDLSRKKQKIQANYEENWSFMPMLSKKSMKIAQNLEKPLDRLVSSQLKTQEQIAQLKKEIQSRYSFRPTTNDLKNSQITSRSANRDQRESKSPMSQQDNIRYFQKDPVNRNHQASDRFQDNSSNWNYQSEFEDAGSSYASNGGDQNIPCWQRLFELNKKREITRKIQKMQQERISAQDPELTFHPNLKNNQSMNFISDQEFDVAHRNQSWLLRKEEKIQQQREAVQSRETVGCTFKPEIHSRPDLSEKKFVVTNFNKKGIIQYFERIDQANQKRKSKQRQLNQNDGSTWSNKLTIPKEFQFMKRSRVESKSPMSKNNNNYFHTESGSDMYNQQYPYPNDNYHQKVRSHSSNGFLQPDRDDYNFENNSSIYNPNNQGVQKVVNKVHQKLFNLNM